MTDALHRAASPLDALRPGDAADVAGAVAEAAAAGTGLELLAGGTKRAYGRPGQGRLLDLSALSGVLEYEPAELVLTARAATPLATIEALLAQHRQMLAFEPVSWRGLLDGRPADPDGPPLPEEGADGAPSPPGPVTGPTLGGTLACNLAGPRRVRAGGARDHFLGFAAVNGWGDPYKAGAKVVKNVTGYDLCKLQAGALGTLSVLTEVSVKVLPHPETERTLLAAGLDEAGAVRLMAAALNSPHEVSAAAHLPPAQAAATLGTPIPPGGVTALRIEGHAPSVATRAGALEALATLAAGGCELVWLEPAASAALWVAVGEVRALAAAPGQVVWRVSTAPADSCLVAATIRAGAPGAAFLYDWGGAMLWTAVPAGLADGGAALVRSALRGGHATLVRAPAAMRAAVAVFEPEPAPLAALTRRVKDQFDPGRVLNPGRMRPGG